MSEAGKEKTLAELALPTYECRLCGYRYIPAEGDPKRNIAPGTAFTDLPETWRCPVCGARKSAFVNIGASDAPSGFAENLDYGFGVNRLTPRQKSILIYGSLILAFLFFMSLYALD